MDKVVTTRPRGGGATTQRRRGKFKAANKPRETRYYRGKKVDLSLKKESMRKRYHVDGDVKSFEDHIQPLFRYLRSQAGRKWDDVWSDICKRLKGNGLQANHVKEHVKYFVRGIPHSGKTVFNADDWYRGDGYRESVYVDEEGILRRENKKRRKKQQRYHYKRESDTVEYHKINGCWFRIEFKTIEEIISLQNRGIWESTYFKETKRALSRKEAKKLNLDRHYETMPGRYE